MQAEIIAVGTELLLGQVVNTNATFLSEELADLGFNVYYQSVVGDNQPRLEKMLALATERSELIILCGGLGPTEDDLTKEVVADFVGEKLVEDPAGKENLLAFFKQAQREMTPNNLQQVQILTNSQALPNKTGLAVGIFYQTKKNAYLLLPGPPSELRPMFQNYANPLLKKLLPQKDQLLSRVLRFYGIGESNLVTKLADLIATQTEPTIAPYAKPNEVTLRLTLKTTDPAQGKKLLDQTEGKIMAQVGEFFYGYGENNSLVEVTVDLLKKQKKTITAAESLTAGAFQATLGDVPGVSAVFPGGFVTYSAETKARFLQIESALIERYGVVSQECAEAMAVNARKLAGTDYAVSLTGVAGPSELEGQPAGTVWIGLAGPAGVKSRLCHFTRDRSYIRHSAVMAGLDFLRRELLKS